MILGTEDINKLRKISYKLNEIANSFEDGEPVKFLLNLTTQSELDEDKVDCIHIGFSDIDFLTKHVRSLDKFIDKL